MKQMNRFARLLFLIVAFVMLLWAYAGGQAHTDQDPLANWVIVVHTKEALVHLTRLSDLLARRGIENTIVRSRGGALFVPAKVAKRARKRPRF